MTFRMALKLIRKDKSAKHVEETFRIICRNRYCHPVRDWAIYDEPPSCQTNLLGWHCFLKYQ